MNEAKIGITPESHTGKFLKDLSGKVFNRLSVVEFSHSRKSGGAMWVCKCICGTVVTVLGASLSRGHSQSCGCLRMERSRAATTIHGMNSSPEHAAWMNMKSRCKYKTNPQWGDYGGRGIQVCKRWLDGEDGKSGFECFFEDMGRKSTTSHSLERVNNSKGYSPENCKWELRRPQNLNKRNTVKLRWGGKEKPLLEWAEERGMKYYTLWSRLFKRKWSVEKSLTAPPFFREK